MKTTPKKILLIVNPVSGRMKSTAGLSDILDELYRNDRVDLRKSHDSTEIIERFYHLESANDNVGDPTEMLPYCKDGEDLPPPRRRFDSVKAARFPRHAIARPIGKATEKPAAGPSSFPRSSASPSALGGDFNPTRRVTVTPTMHRGHASKLAATASVEGYDTVICCGGDGTFNETVTGLMSIPAKERPVLGYIPAGSTNDFAASMGLSGSLREAARTTVGKRDTRIDVGLFSPLGLHHPPARYFTYIASFGIFTAASYSTPQTAKNLFGHLAYLVEGLKDLANIQAHHAVFVLPDGTRIEGDFIFGAVSNTTSAGGVLKLPSDLVSLSDGRMELFLIHAPKSPLDLQKIATALLAQDFENCPLIELHHIRAVRVLLDSNLSWSLDGEEAVGGRRVEIKCLRGGIRLKTPQ